MKALALLTGSSQDPNHTNRNSVDDGLAIKLDPMNKLRNMHVFKENICKPEI